MKTKNPKKAKKGEDVPPRKGNKRKNSSKKYMMRPSFSDYSNSDDDSDSEDVATKKYPNPNKKGKNSPKKKDDEYDSPVDVTSKKGKK